MKILFAEVREISNWLFFDNPKNYEPKKQRWTRIELWYHLLPTTVPSFEKEPKYEIFCERDGYRGEHNEILNFDSIAEANGFLTTAVEKGDVEFITHEEFEEIKDLKLQSGGCVADYNKKIRGVV